MRKYFTLLVLLAAAACGPRVQVHEDGGFMLLSQSGGPDLGYTSAGILQVHGHAFKDLNRNEELDPYEDWRLSAQERARDLASRLSVEEIAGLMLYSSHQAVPGSAYGFGAATYEREDHEPWDLTDQQKKFLLEDHLRAVLVTTVESPAVAARWNNTMQAFVEGLDHGIPVNISSDPRNETSATAEFNMGAGGQISLWPTPLGLAATFDPALVKKFGTIASREYRALGIATALSPQIDLATEPRWSRFGGTFGEDMSLDRDMARAYVDGFQTTGRKGWGSESVNAMVKHWPSGGPEEGGRDAHFNYGKYAVYPGENLKSHLVPFVDGAFSLEDGTGMAAAVMPYYTITYGRDPSGKNVGNSYSKWLITDILREKYGYGGVVCTDWNITYDNKAVESFDGKCWGVEELSVAERHYEVLKAGVDQFGGNNDKGPVLEAYRMWARDFGEEAARERFEESAVRLLMNYFRTGLFENPYTSPDRAAEVVGNPDFMKAGYEAQQKSVVMVKNLSNLMPVPKGAKVYVPQRYFPQLPGMFGLRPGVPAHWNYPVEKELVQKYFTWTDDPSEANFALVFIQEPSSGSGYDVYDRARGSNGYVPISLQYRPYTAVHARSESIAGGDPKESFTNRSYKGKTVRTLNESDLDLVIETHRRMNGKPVIVAVNLTRPAVLSELEPYAEGILLRFGVQDQAVLDIVSGAVEPSGLLPMQMPVDMQTVEEQFEDVGLDMRVLVDRAGHAWDFGFGLNWNGPICDVRTQRYVPDCMQHHQTL